MIRVYVLGAGASLDLRFDTNLVELTIPACKDKGLLSTGFFYYAKQFEQEILSNRKKIIDPDPQLQTSNIENIPLVKDYLQKNGLEEDSEKIFADEEFSRKINIEAFLKFMENKSEEENKKEREKVSALERRVLNNLSVFSPIHEFIYSSIKMVSFYCYSPLYRKFVREIIQEGDTIISFNWDDLLEEELYAAGDWDYWDGYGFEAKGVKRQGDSVYTLPRRGMCSEILILKPHGSMNWYRKRPAQLVDNSVYVWIPADRALRGRKLYSKEQCRSFDFNSQTNVYFAPPEERKETQFPEIWEQIKNRLEVADELIFIGFAFNEYDAEARNFFQKIAYRQSVRILLVNPDLSSEENYRSIFQPPVFKICSTFNEYINCYARKECF